MTLLFCDGFDHYGTDETNMTDGAYAEVETSTAWLLSTANPRTGTHHMRRSVTSSSEAVVRRVLGGAKTTVGMGVVLFLDQLPATNDVFVVYDFRDTANAIQISVVIQSTGVIDVKRGDAAGTSILASSTPAVVASAYQHIETIATFNNTSGAVEVRVNGVTVVSVSGVDTVATGNEESSQVALLGGPNGPLANTAGVTPDYDDFFCYDDTGSYNNTFLGDRRVLTLFPDADTAQADWSWNTGPAASQAIDEADPDDDTTYIFANPGGSPAPVSEFDIDDLPAGVSAVSAIVLVNRMRKTDAGVANVQPSLVSASSETAGADHPLTEVYTYYHEVVEVDPDTAAPFTPAAVDAAKIKLERTA